jgi:hypothetical protein
MSDLPSPDDTLTRLVNYFTEAEQATIESRGESETARDYYDGIQLTSKEYSVLEKRNQPPVIDNKIKDKVDSLLGMEIETRTDPKAFPRTPAHEGAAEAATDAIRFVADNNFLQQIKSECGNNMFVEGTGDATVTFNPKTKEIEIKQVMWDRFFYDPHSRKKDFSDAKFLGEAIWIDVDDARQKYPGHAEEFDASVTQGHSEYGETYADKPLSKWVDPQRERIRIVEIYYNENGWKRALIGRRSLIEGGQDSVYLDDMNRPTHPHIARSAYVDRNGNRYGVVRRYKDLQDEHNKRRSKLLHLASNRNIVADAGAVDSIKQAKDELAKPDGYITVNPGKRFEVLDNNAEIAAHTQLLLMTDQALSQTGPNEALQGASGRISGRAKQLDQQAGAINLGTLFDGLRDWELRVYRKIWNCIQQFWTDEKWVRVRDDERNLKFVSINHIKTQGEAFEELSAQAQQQGGPPPPPPPDPSAPLIDSKGNPVKENDVVNLDVDIIIETAPDIVSIQQEQFKELSQLASSGMVPIPPDVLIEASTLRNKRQLLAQMRGETPEGQQQAQMKQMLEGIQMILAQLSVTEKEAEIDKTVSEAEENRSQTELNLVEAFNVGEGDESVG